MLQSQDFKDLLSILAKHEVRYLVIGGYAHRCQSRIRSGPKPQGCRGDAKELFLKHHSTMVLSTKITHSAGLKNFITTFAA
jgi:hypothetical protein